MTDYQSAELTYALNIGHQNFQDAVETAIRSWRATPADPGVNARLRAALKRYDVWMHGPLPEQTAYVRIARIGSDTDVGYGPFSVASAIHLAEVVIPQWWGGYEWFDLATAGVERPKVCLTPAPLLAAIAAGTTPAPPDVP